MSARAPTDAVVLAAGRGRRMGGPKHLLALEGAPLVVRVSESLRASQARSVTVVLRPDDAEGARCLSGHGIAFVRAEDAEEGRAASLRAGVRAAGADADLLVALADQPFLTPADFDALIAARDRGRIVHARYAGERGSPVLFDRAYRAELLSLHGSEGGRVLIARHPDDCAPVDLEPAHGRDLDRPEDLATLR